MSPLTKRNRQTSTVFLGEHHSGKIMKKNKEKIIREARRREGIVTGKGHPAAQGLPAGFLIWTWVRARTGLVLEVTVQLFFTP